MAVNGIVDGYNMDKMEYAEVEALFDRLIGCDPEEIRGLSKK